MANEKNSETKPNELRLTRIFNAPVKLVWDAWTDEKQTAQWWGPRGFTLTTHSKDLRVGGIWHYTMHGPDGTDYPNKTKYFEVEKHKRLVYDHGGYDERAPLFRVTVDFQEVKGGTKMDMVMAFATPEKAAESKKFIKKAGGDSTWDRLAEYLDKDMLGKDRFVINRSFATSLENMYEMWTNPEHFSKWLPPTGMRMEFIKADIRAGGSTFYMMTNDSGLKFYGKAEYLELERPTRLVYTQQFTDEHGKVSRHPFAPLWPETMLSTVTLTAEGAGQTRVRVEWEPYGPTKPEELAVFIKERGGMTQGWTGSFDKLEELLGS